MSWGFNAITDVENRRGPGSVMDDTLLEVLESVPVPDSQFDTWWGLVKDTIMSDASTQDALGIGAAAGSMTVAPVLSAGQLLESYVKKLMAEASWLTSQPNVSRKWVGGTPL